MIVIELNIFFPKTYHFHDQAGLRRKRKEVLWIQVEEAEF